MTPCLISSNYQCTVLSRTVIRFKNRVEKRIEVIQQCSNLLVLLYQLRFEQLSSIPAAEAAQQTTRATACRPASAVMEDCTAQTIAAIERPPAAGVCTTQLTPEVAKAAEPIFKGEAAASDRATASIGDIEVIAASYKG